MNPRSRLRPSLWVPNLAISLCSATFLCCLSRSPPWRMVTRRSEAECPGPLKCSPTWREPSCLLIVVQCPFICCRSLCSVSPMYHASGHPCLMRRMTITINDKMDKVKKELFGRLPDFASSSGLTVLEVGCGTGANFQYYPWGCKVICTDPNPNFEPMLKSSGAKSTQLKLERFVVAHGENLSQVASGSVDAVVCTLVLCTAQNVDAVLKEIKRVLRPGGAFFFIEHVAADKETWLHFIQHVIQPAWRYFGDGCYLTRDTSAHLEKANFSELNLKHIIAPLMSLIKHHIVGYAVK